MRCLRTIKAGFDKSGTSVIYNSRKSSQELAPFEFECRKCLPCRLKIGREKAIRAMHEAKMHKENIFLTLTYSEENLKSPRLNYYDFELFMKRLLEDLNRNITCKENRHILPFMVTGEYGDKTKRPHWHVLLFNYRPHDAQHHRYTDLGHQVFKSDYIAKIWKHGFIEFGEITMESASYVGRYAAKKLSHGKDQEHDYHPIHNTSKRHVIGKSWLKKNAEQIFKLGYVTLPNGQKCSIPRYYLDYVKKNIPELYFHYISEVQPKTILLAQEQTKKEEMAFLSNLMNYQGMTSYPLTTKQVKHTILKQKFKQLQENLKL